MTWTKWTGSCTEYVGNHLIEQEESEYQLQAWMYHELKLMGFNVKTELTVRTADKDRVGRADLVLCNSNNHPYLVLELKKDLADLVLAEQQARAYATELGCHWAGLAGKENMEDFLAWLHQCLQENMQYMIEHDMRWRGRPKWINWLHKNSNRLPGFDGTIVQKTIEMSERAYCQ